MTTLYFTDAAGASAALDTFLIAIAANVPLDVTIQAEAAGDEVDSATGVITGTWVDAPTTPHVGADTFPYSGPAGFEFQWLTPTIHNGRHVRGKTYIVPAGRGGLDTDGTYTSVFTAAIAAVGATFVAAATGNFQIWSRPRLATPSWTDVHGKIHPAKSAVPGAAAPVGGVRVPDKVVVLRSRRD